MKINILQNLVNPATFLLQYAPHLIHFIYHVGVQLYIFADHIATRIST